MKKIIIALSIVLWLAGAGMAPADDTAIYGAATINIQPNVLIIFDTSGSMSTKDVPGEYYDPATVYTGTYTSNAVYRSWWWGNWQLHANDISDLNCSTIENQLSTTGVYQGRVGSSPSYGCSGWKQSLRTGNWLNYDISTGGALRTRIDVAQEVITNLINNTNNVRFGLMRFNGSDGGMLSPHGAIGSAKSDLVADVAAFTAGGMTPLAETLAEAGLYFAGKEGWFNGGVTYTSPMQYECQKNFVIFMTDGEPTADDDARLNTGAYVNAAGDPIGDYDNDGSTTMYRLDDVAKYLYENDINLNLGTAGDTFEVQNIKTYTIGFTTNQALLQDTADDQHGRGKYYTTSSISGLEAALQEIMSDIAAVNATYVSPVVPISRMNQVYSGNKIYIGFFKPQVDGWWFGNIKRYGLDNDGDLVDQNNNLATDSNGAIVETALSDWSLTSDGPTVNKGGIGDVLLGQAVRHIYTNMGASSDLTSASNAFAKSNADITPALLDVATAAERDAVIDDIHGVSKNWKLGDILHSEPTVVAYGGDAMIFVGSNDGMLHCFNDQTGVEEWAYIPYEQLARLKSLSDGDTTHEYFMDGTPTIYDDGSQKILLVGERRGGSYYYALDVTSYSSPRFLYKIAPTILGGGAATLGQSWGRPQIAKIATGAGGTEPVFLLPGGYDNTNQDLAIPAAGDTLGRAAFSVKVATGALGAFNDNAASAGSGLDHSIVDLVGIDPDNDCITNRIYAPDTGGQVFAYEDDNLDGTWTGRKLFSASALDSVQRKIFYAPDMVKVTIDLQVGEMIFFGTGDRADPEETGVVNRFYAVKNVWTNDFADLDESDLVDVTDDMIQMGDTAERDAAKATLESSKGWFIRFSDPGEKVINAPVVYGGVVYFTTYVPETLVPSGNPCDTVGGRGYSYLYAVDYQTGASVLNYSSTTETNGDGDVVDLGKNDRRVKDPRGPTTTPVISVSESGTHMYSGGEGGVKKDDPISRYIMNMYYWRDR